MPYTVTQLARALDVSSNTVRNWGDEFAEFLSDDANPPGRVPRRYNEDDLSVLTTVALLRQQQQPYEDIHAHLAAGDRLEPVEPLGTQEESNEGAEAESTALAPLSLLEAFRAEFQDHIDTLKEQLDRERELHDEARAALKEAQEHARHLEEQLRQQARENAATGESDAPGSEPDGRRWWQFWK